MREGKRKRAKREGWNKGGKEKEKERKGTREGGREKEKEGRKTRHTETKPKTYGFQCSFEIL